MKKKIVISKLFLYKHRFVIGYVVLGLVFAVLLFLLPFIAQRGLSTAEIESATQSYRLSKSEFLGAGLVDFPYHLLQKFSIAFFGLTPFSIKLPSIIIGLVLGFLLILLLNRWFLNNVSLLSSCLVVLSTPFLFLAGSGTPLIMLVFWPTLLLWLGSKIQGEKKPKLAYCFCFALALLLAIFTPYMIYFAVFCVFFILLQPHLRFVVKSFSKSLLIVLGLMAISGVTLIAIGIHNDHQIIRELLFANNFSLGDFLPNIAHGLAPVFSWYNSVDGVFLSPLISLPVFALALIGLFSTSRGFFASRNSIASILIIFCLVITGFNQNAAIFFILPFSILIAHGVKYLLEKWYGLFPENPYARISALVPLTVLFALIIVPGLLQYIYGYRYNPIIADRFSYDLSVINHNLNDGVLIVNENYDFYKILEDSSEIIVESTMSPNVEKVAFLGKPDEAPDGYALERIITSPLRDNSDIIYIYTAKLEGE